MISSLDPVRVAHLVRIVNQAIRKQNPRLLFIAVCLFFVEPAKRHFSDEQVARHLARCVEDCRGHINRLVEMNKDAAQKSPHCKSHVIQNITTLESALYLGTVKEHEDAFNTVLRLLAEATLSQLPKGTVEVSIDEMEFPVTFTDEERARLERHYGKHFVVPGGKKDTFGKEVLRYTVACLHVYQFNLNIPIYFSLETHDPKDEEGGFLPLPTAKKIVRDFLEHLEGFSVQPRWVYADRRFCGYGVFDECIAYKVKQAERGVDTDFQIPAVKWGRGGRKADLITSKAIKTYRARRASVAQVIDNGDLLATDVVTRRPRWRLRVYETGDPDGPYVPEGMFLHVFTVPAKDVEDESNSADHEGGFKSFGNWSTAKFTPTTAYERYNGYLRRNNVEAMVQTYRARLDISRSPDMRIRTLSFGLGFCLLSIWGLFRLLHGHRVGRYKQGDYSFTHFLQDLLPGRTEELLADLGALL